MIADMSKTASRTLRQNGKSRIVTEGHIVFDFVSGGDKEETAAFLRVPLEPGYTRILTSINHAPKTLLESGQHAGGRIDFKFVDIELGAGDLTDDAMAGK